MKFSEFGDFVVPDLIGELVNNYVDGICVQVFRDLNIVAAGCECGVEKTKVVFDPVTLAMIRGVDVYEHNGLTLLSRYVLNRRIFPVHKVLFVADERSLTHLNFY